MQRKAITAALCMALATGAAGCAHATPADGQVAVVARCVDATMQAQPQAAAWAASYCEEVWQRAVATVAMADAILAVAPDSGGVPWSGAEARGRLHGVQWSSGTEGRLGEVGVSLADSGALSFSWQRTGAEVPYNVIEALRLRGVTLRSLGCPQYPGASMGREKVMVAALPGRVPFTLAVYSRPAPTGIEPGLYQVDVDFSGVVPDSEALRAGRYPGGGGRAFAVDASGWVGECPDPE